MLSVYVNEHNSNWDNYLPYVMMAYRVAVHEITGFTANYISIPLDLMFEMPQALKFISQSKWISQRKVRRSEKISRRQWSGKRNIMTRNSFGKRSRMEIKCMSIFLYRKLACLLIAKVIGEVRMKIWTG